MNGVPIPHLGRDFADARRVALGRAQLAGLTGPQCDDLDEALLDLERDMRLTENIVARLARQGVPVSQLLGLHQKASLIGELRECRPGVQEILGVHLARRMAAGDWRIAGGPTD